MNLFAFTCGFIVTMTTSFVLNSRIDGYEKFKNIYKDNLFKVDLKEPTQNTL